MKCLACNSHEAILEIPMLDKYDLGQVCQICYYKLAHRMVCTHSPTDGSISYELDDGWLNFEAKCRCGKEIKLRKNLEETIIMGKWA